MLKPWTRSEDDRVKIDWRAGVIAPVTAKALSRSARAVRNRRSRLGLSAEDHTPDVERERLINLRSARTATALEAQRLRAIPETANRDDAYVAACMAQGGFCAFSEKRLTRGNVAVCLPVIWPAQTAVKPCCSGESSADSKASGEVFKASPAHRITQPTEQAA